MTPGGVIKAGAPIKVTSTIRVIAGTQEPISEVKEVLIAYAPNGKEFKRGEKKINDATGSGEYTNNFTLTLPKGVPQGVYKLETQVFVNGKLAARKENSIQLAWLSDQPGLAMLVPSMGGGPDSR
ncbi:MAG: hypothetical protein LBE62_02150 [Azonexus sp.]|nr:hypothetical protein [Azonexus sp.]